MDRDFDHSFATVAGRSAWKGCREAVAVDPGERRSEGTQSSRELSVRREERRKERARVARELHDTLFQGFFGASLMLQSIVDQLPADSASGSSLHRALSLMRRVLDEGRDTLHKLHSQETSATGLEQALAAIGKQLASVETQFQISALGRPEPLDPAVQEQAFLIGREALVNAFRHSGAASVEVEFEYLPRCLRVIVRDDGAGIDPEVLRSGRHSGRGLLGMRERAKNIRAQLRIWSRRGAGTEIEVSVPHHIAVNGIPPQGERT